MEQPRANLPNRCEQIVARFYQLLVGFIILTNAGCEGGKHLRFQDKPYLGTGFLRIHNGSNEDLFDVVFQGNRFGNIPRGQVTEYQLAGPWHTNQVTILPGDYPQHEISLRRAGFTNRMGYVWVDWGGRMVKGSHRFTFVITLHEGSSGGGKHIDIHEESRE